MSEFNEVLQTTGDSAQIAVDYTKNELGDITSEKIGVLVGGAGGGLIGTTALGGACSTFAPGAGTAICGTIGGVIGTGAGGLAGGIAGRILDKKVGKPQQLLEKLVNDEGVQRITSNITDQTKEVINTGLDLAKSGTETVVQLIKKPEEVVEKGKEVVKNVSKGAEEVIKGIGKLFKFGSCYLFHSNMSIIVLGKLKQHTLYDSS